MIAVIYPRKLVHLQVAAVAVNVSISVDLRLSSPILIADVTWFLFAPTNSAASAQTVATNAAAEATTVFISLKAPSLCLGKQKRFDEIYDVSMFEFATVPAIAAANLATARAA